MSSAALVIANATMNALGLRRSRVLGRLAQRRRELLGPHREREQRAQLAGMVGVPATVLLEEALDPARVDPVVETIGPVDA